MNRFAVVLLNWNAPQDTTECLDSILSTASDALPIVIDNGSEDDSVVHLGRWATSRDVDLFTCSASQMRELSQADCRTGVVLVQSSENLGFAKGCNLGLRVAQALQISETIFLNNDTVVCASSLVRLVERLRADPSIFATVPVILLHGTRTIWNAGGKISRLGYRRYFLAGACVDKLTLTAEIDCSFFTGCCFAVRTVQFAERAGFSERFFFGEEDFELCLWMKDNGKRAVVLTESVIEHKVSLTFARASRDKAGRAYVYYLNRFIHMRLRLGQLAWLLWLTCYVPYVAITLGRASAVDSNELMGFLRSLVSDAKRYDGVDRALFMRIMAGS